MFTLKNEKLKKIKAYLSRIYCFVELSKSEGLTDDSKELEDFSRGLLNLLFDCHLENLNTLGGANFPAIDLGDESIRRAFQVTSDGSKAKVSDTLQTFDEHKLWEKYDKPEFVIFVQKKRKPSGFLNSTNYAFNPETDILYINDLFQAISSREDKLDQVIAYFEKNLDPLIGEAVTTQTQEMLIFKLLFSGIAEVSKQDASTLEENGNSPDESDLNLKKEKFPQFWKLIEQNYTEMIDTSREKIYATVEGTFSEDDLIAMKDYLKLTSRKCLFEAENNPIKGIDLLKSKIISDLNLQFMSETEIEYFLYYQLYYCFVFPN